jgi:endoglucanase
VEQHGKLKVVDGKLVDKSGSPTQLKGMSLFWSMWSSKWWTSEIVDWLVSDWKISLIRAPMGVGARKKNGGYTSKPDKNKALVKTVVDAAIAKGIYVLVDWHTQRADKVLDEATEFFQEMAETYGDVPNVLFEIFNEPVGIEWPKIKEYHETIVPVIRNHSSNPIILGTGTYSQRVDTASEDPVTGDNLAYTLHFYAVTHKEDLRKKAQKALDAGLALFVTEFGTCDASGNGTLDFDSTRTWMDFLNNNSISWANWAVDDKLEAASALKPGSSTSGGWEEDDLTYSGTLIRNILKGQDTGEECDSPGWPCKVEPGSCAAAGQGCKHQKCCLEASEGCFAKDDGWAQCMASCTPGPHETDPKEYRTPWSCELSGEPPKAEPCSGTGKACTKSKCCAVSADSCFVKDASWAQCMPACKPGKHEEDPTEFRTPWSCEVLSPAPGPAAPGGLPIWVLILGCVLLVAVIVVIAVVLQKNNKPAGSPQE